MTPLATDRLVLRNWQESDRPLFHLINSDERVMEFFPFRRDRAQSDALMDLLRTRIDEDGHGFAAIELAATGECIGFAGITQTRLEPFFPDHTMEIGWRLAPQHWGKGYASEAAHAWLAVGFGRLELDEIVSFAVRDNHRSLSVMKRIGMVPDPGRDFDHPRVPDTHPHLRAHATFAARRV
jgi:RimJ/RimL family protein N-acetyltransferase